MEKNTCAGQINPFLGANAPGNFFSGPYLPYAVARLGADTIYPQNAGGYQRGRPVKCISHLHVGGTGGAGRYGNIGVTAYPGPATVRPPYMELTGEQAQAGYYSACTRAGVRLELTSTQHTGVHRFSFPQGQEANVFIDAAAVIQTEGAFPGEHAPGAGHIAVDATGACIGGYVEQVSACEFCGRGDFIGGWGHRFPYSVCFFARFDRPARSVLLANSRGVYRSACAAGEGSCINASFGAGELELRVGVSFVSVANARAYVDDEAAQSFDALCGVELGEEYDDSDGPALYIYYARQGERIFDIARRYHARARDLAAANHLDTNGDPPQELTTDTACLLIPAAL